eukprot:gb/GFBE01007153.1/.p1 GENE.gb/GFBE01007153.1/~~gb/GFBE01007153.1/.p1  ORF type:complete len:277 (+),score=78.31 gb/GFBE01007153.1/:1-831(+)
MSMTRAVNFAIAAAAALTVQAERTGTAEVASTSALLTNDPCAFALESSSPTAPNTIQTQINAIAASCHDLSEAEAAVQHFERKTADVQGRLSAQRALISSLEKEIEMLESRHPELKDEGRDGACKQAHDETGYVKSGSRFFNNLGSRMAKGAKKFFSWGRKPSQEEIEADNRKFEEKRSAYEMKLLKEGCVHHSDLVSRLSRGEDETAEEQSELDLDTAKLEEAKLQLAAAEQALQARKKAAVQELESATALLGREQDVDEFWPEVEEHEHIKAEE